MSIKNYRQLISKATATLMLEQTISDDKVKGWYPTKSIEKYNRYKGLIHELHLSIDYTDIKLQAYIQSIQPLINTVQLLNHFNITHSLSV
jgi:hypothetical protein